VELDGAVCMTKSELLTANLKKISALNIVVNKKNNQLILDA